MTKTLYDPSFEHDACGVGMVADLTAKPTQRDDPRRADDPGEPRASRRLRLRRRLGRRRRPAHPDAGLLRPLGLWRRRTRRRAVRPRALDGAQEFRRRGLSRHHRRGTRARRSRVARLARRARRLDGCSVPPPGPPSRASSNNSSSRGSLNPAPDLERALYCARKVIEHTPRRLRLVVFTPRAHLQGDADVAAAAPVLRRPARRATHFGHRRRAQSLLDQRPAALGPRPALSLHRAQRRDQHRAGQPQLDDGARDHAAQRRATAADSTNSRPSSPTA